DRVHACDHAVILASAWPATALRRTRCRCVAQSGPQPHLPPFRCTAAERAGSGIVRPLVPSRGLNAGEWGGRRGRLRNHYAVRAGLCPVTAQSWAVVKRRLVRAFFLAVAGSVTLAACTSGGPRAGPALPGHWVRFRHVPGVVDLAGPRSDGSFTVAAAGRLFILSTSGALRPFAPGPGGYFTATRGEPDITLAGSGRVAGTRCPFPRGMIFALQPGRRPGIIRVGATGLASRFADLPAAVTPNGITFDSVGHFGHKLLVTARNHARTTVLAIDCTG